jgi:hypothetical protein
LSLLAGHIAVGHGWKDQWKRRLVLGKFGLVWFLAKFPKPKPKPIQTVYIGLVWFKLGLRPFPMASPAQTGQLPLATPPLTVFINKDLFSERSPETHRIETT